MTTGPYDDPPTEGPSDDTEYVIRQGLRAAAGAVAPSPWPGASVRARARGVRRARRLAAVLPVVAAVTVGAVLAAGQLRERATGKPSGPAAPTAGRGSHLPTGPAVDVIPASRSVDLGGGLRMRLAPTKRCFSSGGAGWECEAVASDGGVPWIDPRVRTTPDGTIYVPLYIGPRGPARMILTVGGHAYPLRMVALPGSPGYTAGYLAAPPPAAASVSVSETTVRAYDGRGAVLATATMPVAG
ncbi:hypothetical protein ABZ901_10790 [Actinacidiphila alni]|uniref:hypothetical protein n=1 Tax=Actinacidiphila alni TaxID=380248 RepID=UPI0033FEE37D